MKEVHTIQMIVFDWAGTTVDYGSGAPGYVFADVFGAAGIQLTREEINRPMGMEKKAHIRELLSCESGNSQWLKLYGRPWTESDVDELYQKFEAKLYEVVAQYSAPMAGVVETVEKLREQGLKIGSTTGYTSRMMEQVLPRAGDADKAIYHSVLVVSSQNEEIQSIEDIKGKTMAFVDPDSTSGNLVPTAEIIQAFPDDNLNSDILHTNGDFFEAVSFSGSHQAGLQAVIKGDVDVVPISDQILASEIANGNAAEEDVKIIHESGAIPAEAMVVAGHVDEDTRDRLTEFLSTYDNEDYFSDVIKVPGARFIECDMSDYEDIIELNRIINEF